MRKSVDLKMMPQNKQDYFLGLFRPDAVLEPTSFLFRLPAHSPRDSSEQESSSSDDHGDSSESSDDPSDSPEDPKTIFRFDEHTHSSSGKTYRHVAEDEPLPPLSESQSSFT